MNSQSQDRGANSRLRDAARVVVKIGSSLLIDAAQGQLNRDWLVSLAGEVARLHKRGQQVLLVSSGAIGLGRRHLNFAARDSRLTSARLPG